MSNVKKAVGLTGVGQMLGYDTRSWKVSQGRWPNGDPEADRKYYCVVLERYGKSVAAFKTRRQLLIAFRDAINGMSATVSLELVLIIVYDRTLELVEN